MRKKIIIKAILLLLVVAGIFALASVFDLATLLSPTSIQTYVDGFGALGGIVFVGLYAAATIFFVPGTLLTLLGGALFGGVLGTIYVVVGATIGATVSFLIARLLGKEFADKILKGKFKKIDEYDDKIAQNGLKTMLVLRLLPIFPFTGLNYGMGLTRMKFRDYLIGTFFGIMPGTAAFVYFGDSLTKGFNPQLLLASLVLIAAVLLPGYIKKKLHKEPATVPETPKEESIKTEEPSDE